MKNLKKIILVLSFLFVSSLTLAQPGDIDDEEGDNDPVPIPIFSIDQNIFGLAVLGIGLAFYVNYLKKKRVV